MIKVRLYLINSLES